MTLVEKLASKSRMQKVVLTVLINNVAAVEFYRKLNYTNNEKLDKTYRNRSNNYTSSQNASKYEAQNIEP